MQACGGTADILIEVLVYVLGQAGISLNTFTLFLSRTLGRFLFAPVVKL